MRRWFLVSAVFGVAVAPFALAQEAEPVPVATITFEPETYESYKEFTAKAVASVEDRIAALKSLSPETPRVRIGSILSDPTLGNCLALRDVLAESPVLDGDSGRYVLRFSANDPDYVVRLARDVNAVKKCFRPQGDTAAFEAKRAENDAKVEKLDQDIHQLKERQREIEEEQGKLGTEKANSRIERAEDAMLDLRLAQAEAEARRETGMGKLEQVRKQPAEEAAGVQQKKKQYAQQKVELAAKAVNRVKQLHNQGLTGSAELERAEQALAEAQLEAAMFDEEANAPRPSSPAETQLTAVIIEAEIDLAGLEARSRVLREEMASLSAVLDNQAALVEEYNRANDRVRELVAEAKKLREWPKSASDFPVPKPVIEWAQRPGE